jgi:hypothetical protein
MNPISDHNSKYPSRCEMVPAQTVSVDGPNSRGAVSREWETPRGRSAVPVPMQSASYSFLVPLSMCWSWLPTAHAYASPDFAPRAFLTSSRVQNCASTHTPLPNEQGSPRAPSPSMSVAPVSAVGDVELFR